jgi:hypothetical protein
MRRSEAYKQWLKKPDVKRELSIWSNPGVKVIALVVLIMVATGCVSCLIFAVANVQGGLSIRRNAGVKVVALVFFGLLAMGCGLIVRRLRRIWSNPTVKFMALVVFLLVATGWALCVIAVLAD